MVLDKSSEERMKALMIFIIFTLSGCSTSKGSFVVRWWDGYYSMKSASRNYDKKAEEYYSREQPEQKTLREQNKSQCIKFSHSIYNERYPKDNRVNMNDIFVHCMRVNGTPLYKDIPKKYDWLTDDDVRIKK